MSITRSGLTGLVLLLAGVMSSSAQEAPKRGPSPELDACRSTGLLALREKSPGIKDVVFDPDATTIAKADTKVEDTPVKTVIMGDAYLERRGTEKPYRFLCLIGEKGKVLLTFFTQD